MLQLSCCGQRPLNKSLHPRGFRVVLTTVRKHLGLMLERFVIMHTNNTPWSWVDCRVTDELQYPMYEHGPSRSLEDNDGTVFS